MPVVVAAVAAIGLLLLPGPALACQITTETPLLTIYAAGGTFYLVEDDCAGDCWIHVGVYRELNGFPGLQRQDFGYDDTCGLIPADPRVI
jgi:hypothetical protein